MVLRLSQCYDHKLAQEVLDGGATDILINHELLFDQVFGSLRTLHFSYCDKGGDSYKFHTPENIFCPIKSTQSTLRHISITLARGFQDTLGYVFMSDSDLLNSHFPLHKSVEFSRLRPPDADRLRDFLLRHALTLREIRLTDCSQDNDFDVVDNSVAMAIWGRGSLTLTGIETIHAVDFKYLVAVKPSDKDENNLKFIIAGDPIMPSAVLRDWKKIGLAKDWQTPCGD